MKADNFDLRAYLDRIGHAGTPTADLAGISAMMARQLYSVPFENLDVQAGKIVSLVPEHIVDKIVNGRRGGYCYEVNGLFAMALEALGVPYRMVAARPMFYPVRRPRTHMALVATIDGHDWLCDLGFGSYGIRAPLRLDASEAPVAQGYDSFMLSRPNEREYVLQALVEGAWANQYGFDLSPQEWVDFAPANYMNSTHPDTLFVQKLLLVLHDEEGRSILVGDAFKNVRRGEVTRQTIEPSARRDFVRERFGLTLPA